MNHYTLIQTDNKGTIFARRFTKALKAACQLTTPTF